MSACLFCRIVASKIPANLLYQDERWVAFADVNPQAPVHVLVIPREHFEDIGGAPAELLGALLHAAAAIGKREAPGGYRVVVNTGAEGGQSVQHVHLHVLGGRPMSWPPG